MVKPNLSPFSPCILTDGAIDGWMVHLAMVQKTAAPPSYSSSLVWPTSAVGKWRCWASLSPSEVEKVIITNYCFFAVSRKQICISAQPLIYPALVTPFCFENDSNLSNEIEKKCISLFRLTLLRRNCRTKNDCRDAMRHQAREIGRKQRWSASAVALAKIVHRVLQDKDVSSCCCLMT